MRVSLLCVLVALLCLSEVAVTVTGTEVEEVSPNFTPNTHSLTATEIEAETQAAKGERKRERKSRFVGRE